MTKPPYRVPLMSEIEAPWNGLKVASTFSGAGGSCLGYRMAGCRVVWASEFVPAAQEVYKLNHPNSILDTRDIREVQPEEILEAIGMERGELDILDGSPPCAAFSTAGKGSKGWGEVKAYSDTSQRVDDLFFEYARILEGLQPRAFVAENVAGLVRGKAKGYFKLILKRLKDCGYNVRAAVLDASWLGVPQSRRRLIFIGFRDDLGIAPQFPKPLPYQYTVREAIGSGEAFRVVHDTSGQFSVGDITDRPAATITVSGSAAPLHMQVTQDDVLRDPETDRALPLGHRYQRRRLTLGELRKLSGFPADFKLSGTYEQRWERMARAVPPVMMAKIAAGVVEGFEASEGSEDDEDKETDIRGYAIGREALTLAPGGQSERYFNLVRPSWSKPCPTITQTAAIRGAAGVIHPEAMRKMYSWEIRRLCGVPDDFRLSGSYQQRAERLGRAVPPVMMAKIARAVVDSLRGS